MLRAALVFGVGYALWLPLQPLYTRLVAAAAAPILRLVDNPPIVTSLAARDNSILLHSFLTGFNDSLGAWSTETMGVFVLAPLVLVLAAPVGRAATRWSAALGVLALVFAVSVGIAVTQIRLVVQAQLTDQLGVTVYTAGEMATLQRSNAALHVIGMLALPAFVFLATYVIGLWLHPAEQEGRVPGVRFRAAYAVPLTVAVLALIAWGLLAAVPAASRDSADHHAGWAKLLRLNPDFATAQVNVALHLESQDRIDEAIELYRSAVLSRPDLPAVHYNLGNALAKRGLDEQAVEAYGTVLELSPGHTAAHRNLGLALARLDRPCAALQHLELSTDASAAANALLLQRIEALEAACSPGP